MLMMQRAVPRNSNEGTVDDRGYLKKTWPVVGAEPRGETKSPESTKDKTTEGTDKTSKARTTQDADGRKKQAHTRTAASTRQKTQPHFPRTFCLGRFLGRGPRS